MSPVNAIIFLPLVAVGLLPSAGVVSQGESLLLSAIALVVAFASPRALAWMRPESAVVRPIAVGPREQRVIARLAWATFGVMVAIAALAVADVISMGMARAILVTIILLSLAANMVWFAGTIRDRDEPPHGD